MNDFRNKVLIYGSKDFAKILRDLLKHLDLNFAGYIDDFNKGNEIVGNFDFVIKNLSSAEYSIVIGIGYNNLSARWDTYQKVKKAGYICPILIHKMAIVNDNNNISEGSIIMAGAIVDTNAKINELCVLWPGVIVNHDSIIGCNTFISPGSIICGFVSTGINCFIGAGAVVIDHNNVPENSFIKAGQIFYMKNKLL